VPNAFLLDPADSWDQSPIPRFFCLALERAGWDTARAENFEAGMDGARWFSSLREGITGSDILVCLGNFHALLQSGTRISEFLTMIRDKIDSGCPAVFQVPDSLGYGSFVSDCGKRKILNFFDSYGVHLTTKRVTSRIHEFSSHGSPSCCIFRRADDSLLDPDLFQNVESVTGSGSHLLQYEPEIFPMVEASGLHFFVDVTTDFSIAGNLGQRNAVAVRRNHESQNLLVISGFFLNDRVETSGGVLPGFEDNVRFAESVIDFLTLKAQRKTQYVMTAYELFRELERRLGILIESVLRRRISEEYFFNSIPASIREKMRTQNGRFDYSLATYAHLVQIIKAQWEEFEPFFAVFPSQQSKHSSAIGLLFKINMGQRVYLAHPHKASQQNVEFGPSDVALIKQALDLVRRASAATCART
jgi:hypothetical protein